MQRYAPFVVLLMLVAMQRTACARQLSGLDFPEQVRLPDTQQVLVLNGAGTVRRWFTPVLVAGLYLPQRQADAARAIALPGTKRVVLHVLYDGISVADLAEFWKACSHDEPGSQDPFPMQSNFERLSAMLEGVKSGDAITIDLLPGLGSRVTVNGRYRGTLKGEGMARAMLRVWLGDTPADSGLKQALLGG